MLIQLCALQSRWWRRKKMVVVSVYIDVVLCCVVAVMVGVRNIVFLHEQHSCPLSLGQRTPGGDHPSGPR